MMSKMIEPITFTVPLSFEAHDIAQQCAQKSLPTKFKQVYLNTLAVYAVDSYLRCMGFETNLAHSESRDSLMLKFVDVADLDIVGVGKIECRPVLPDSQTCNIPSDAWENRIGYVAVQLNQSLKEATLLGFTKTSAMREVPLTQLQSLEYFLAYMNRIQQLNPVNLMNWFENVFDTGWQVIDELLNPEQLEWHFRSTNALPIERGYKIDLGMQLAQQSVTLAVMLAPEPGSEVDIQVQVYPMGNQTCLPEGLKLIVMDESEEVVLEATSRDDDNFIQLEFSSELRELFGVTVALGGASVTKHFHW
ncbi:DUF1822 family protein [Microcoleus sp. PH2017_05_CCC_O_A]|uniref:DUF1822 family protein n=1 Tax=Microcoleus sp. PH2017_05_CCC_O_A TaxID=2798816 RepID=UPI001DE8A5A8|nr:DUF1822 family protein [Microcoleus sp. PH2017_05_CCC_O_A]MCC3435628.1 DUF1822 family protein [Microcoleus sp. PH2017_05_CCC_O_A]